MNIYFDANNKMMFSETNNRVLTGDLKSGGYSTEAQAYFDRMTTQPPDGLKDILNTAIVGMVENGIWDELDQFVFMCLHDAQASRLDIKGGTGHSWVGSPTFTAKTGVTFSGAGNIYIDTGFKASTASKMTLYNSSIIFNHGTFANAGISGSYGIQALSIGSGGYANYNFHNEKTGSGTIAWAADTFCMSFRKAQYEVYARKGSTETFESATRVEALDDCNFVIGLLNMNGSFWAGYQSSAKYWGFGSGMDATKRSALNTILNDFMTALPSSY